MKGECNGIIPVKGKETEVRRKERTKERKFKEDEIIS